MLLGQTGEARLAPFFRLSCGGAKVDWIERRRELFRRADADAETLVSNFGAAAYGEARRQAHGPRTRHERPHGHWQRVRIMVAQRRRSRTSDA
jgi:hypothetical protein